MFLTSTDRIAIALVVAIASTCYVAAAVFALPWMAWAWIPLSFVVVVLGHLVGLEPMAATATAAAVLVAVGLLRGGPAVTLEIGACCSTARSLPAHCCWPRPSASSWLR